MDYSELEPVTQTTARPVMDYGSYVVNPFSNKSSAIRVEEPTNSEFNEKAEVQEYTNSELTQQMIDGYRTNPLASHRVSVHSNRKVITQTNINVKKTEPRMAYRTSFAKTST